MCLLEAGGLHNCYWMLISPKCLRKLQVIPQQRKPNVFASGQSAMLSLVSAALILLGTNTIIYVQDSSSHYSHMIAGAETHTQQ